MGALVIGCTVSTSAGVEGSMVTEGVCCCVIISLVAVGCFGAVLVVAVDCCGVVLVIVVVCFCCVVLLVVPAVVVGTVNGVDGAVAVDELFWKH